MAPPLAHKLIRFAKPLFQAETAGYDFNCVLGGDSKTTDFSSAGAGNLQFGIAAAWPHANWSGFARAGTVNDGSAPKLNFDPGYTTAAAATNRLSGTTYTKGQVGPFPGNGADYQLPSAANLADNTIIARDELLGAYSLTVNAGSFTAVIAGSGVQVGTPTTDHYLFEGMPLNLTGTGCPTGNFRAIVGVVSGSAGLNDFAIVNPGGSGSVSTGACTVAVPSRFASGDWFDSTAVCGRAIFYKDTTGPMFGGAKIQSRRNRGSIINTVEFACNDAVGVSYVDVSHGTGAGYPGIIVRTKDSYDESVGGTVQQSYYHGGFVWYRGTTNNRTPGLMISNIARSGGTTLDLAGAFGDSTHGTNPVSRTNAAAYLQALFTPKYFLIDIGQNATAAETTDFAAGGYSVHKTNLQYLVQAIKDTYTAAGGLGEPVILLCAPYEAGTSAYYDLRAQACYEISLENDCVCFYNTRRAMPKRFGSYSCFTVDGTHPTIGGALEWASALWSACAAEYAASQRLSNEEIRPMGA